MIVLATLLLTIGYDHVVHTHVYPTAALCKQAKAQPMVDIRDRLCVPVQEKRA